jgi:hypothetical protein
MECQYCGSNLKTIKSLKNHQKLARYCLQKQQEQNINEPFISCDGCERFFSSTIECENHCNNCIKLLKLNNKRLKSQLSEKDKIIAELRAGKDIYKEISEDARETIKEIAKQPRTTNNTENKLMLLNPLNLTTDSIKKAIEENFTNEHFLNGQKGIARFAVDNLLKDSDGKLKYICTDPSRHIYKFKTDEGDIERDVKAKKLTNMIAGDITKHSYKMAKNKMEGDNQPETFVMITGTFQDIQDIKEDNADFRLELSNLTVLQ